MISGKLVGLAAFGALLARAKGAVRDSTQASLEGSAKRVVEAMKGAAPVDDSELRDSIRTEPTEQQPGVVIRAGGTPDTMRPSAGGAEGDVAKITEFGTSERAAHPFFFPTFDAYREQVEQEAGEAAERALRDLR